MFSRPCPPDAKTQRAQLPRTASATITGTLAVSLSCLTLLAGCGGSGQQVAASEEVAAPADTTSQSIRKVVPGINSSEDGANSSSTDATEDVTGYCDSVKEAADKISAHSDDIVAAHAGLVTALTTNPPKPAADMAQAADKDWKTAAAGDQAELTKQLKKPTDNTVFQTSGPQVSQWLARSCELPISLP